MADGLPVSWSLPSTRFGAILPVIGPLVGKFDHEAPGANAARRFFRLMPRSIRSDDNRDISVQASRVATPDIATVTRGHQVFRGIIPPVAVEMINDQRTAGGSCFAPSTPSNRSRTPVTRVCSGPNFVVEHQSMFWQRARPVRQRMVGVANEAISRGHGTMIHPNQPLNGSH